MSNKIDLNSTYLEKIITLIKHKESSKLTKIITDIHAADIAKIINNLSKENAKYIYDLIKEDSVAASAIIDLENDVRKYVLNSLSAKKIAKNIIKNLETDDAADLIGELSEEKKEKILNYIEDKNHASDISDLLNYPENTAGGIMAKELIKVNQNWNTVQCLKEMRKQANNIKNVYTIYVVDDNNKLLGLMSLRRLLITQKSTSIKEIMNTDIISVKATKKNEAVANIMQKYDLIVLPVVDNLGCLIGRITIDDIIDLVKEEADKDYQMASGISDDIESNDSIWTLTKARIPWLIIGMIGGIFGAQIIGIFDLKKNFELAFFIPLITAMGGNVGVQSAAIIVQGIANDSLKLESIFQKIIKELGIGIINGLICSIIILIMIIAIGYNLKLSLAVSISLLAVIIFAALFGTITPLTLKKYNIDPALATGPFITTANDVLGLFIYFWIGQSII